MNRTPKRKTRKRRCRYSHSMREDLIKNMHILGWLSDAHLPAHETDRPVRGDGTVRRRASDRHNVHHPRNATCIVRKEATFML